MAARTLAQLQTAVQDYGYGSDTASVQTDFLNASYRRLAGRRRWKWLEAQNSTLTTTVGNSIYTIPLTDMRTLDAVRLTESDGVTTHYITPFQEQDLRSLYHRDLGQNGLPRGWTQYAGKLWLWPTPDQIYTVTFDYIKNITPMVSSTDTTLVPENYDDILVWDTVIRLAIRQRDWLTRNFAIQEREALELAMIAEMQMLNRQDSDTVEDRLWSPR